MIRKLWMGMALVLGASTSAHAATQAVLLARSGPTPLNLPADASITGITSPALNDSGTVVMQVFRNDGGGDFARHLFRSQNGVGELIASAPAGALISDPSINTSGDIAFEVTQTAAQNGIWLFRRQTSELSRVSAAPLGANGWGFLKLNDQGVFGYRAQFTGGQSLVSLALPNTVTVYASESGIDVASPYNFVFAPAFNNALQIAAQVRRVDGNSTEIRRFEANGSSQRIAAQRALDPDSPFFAFDSSVAINQAGEVAFIATLGTGGGAPRGVFRGSPAGITAIARVGESCVSEIEFFPPAINDAGQVVFRGRDLQGRQTLFVGSGAGGLTRVVVRGLTVLPSDLGDAVVTRPLASESAFVGRPAINNLGEIAFIADLGQATNPSTGLGRALYRVSGGEPDGTLGFECRP